MKTIKKAVLLCILAICIVVIPFSCSKDIGEDFSTQQTENSDMHTVPFDKEKLKADLENFNMKFTPEGFSKDQHFKEEVKQKWYQKFWGWVKPVVVADGLGFATGFLKTGFSVEVGALGAVTSSVIAIAKKSRDLDSTAIRQFEDGLSKQNAIYKQELINRKFQTFGGGFATRQLGDIFFSAGGFHNMVVAKIINRRILSNPSQDLDAIFRDAFIETANETDLRRFFPAFNTNKIIEPTFSKESWYEVAPRALITADAGDGYVNEFVNNHFSEFALGDFHYSHENIHWALLYFNEQFVNRFIQYAEWEDDRTVIMYTFEFINTVCRDHYYMSLYYTMDNFPEDQTMTIGKYWASMASIMLNSYMLNKATLGFWM